MPTDPGTAYAARTRAVLAAKKSEGVRLGNPSNIAEAAADRFAANVLQIIASVKAAGATSFDAIAKAPNACGIRTARGGQWYSTTVRNLLLRDRS